MPWEKVIQVGVSIEEYGAIEELAKEDGRSVASWCRRVLLGKSNQPYRPKPTESTPVRPDLVPQDSGSKGLHPKKRPKAPVKESPARSKQSSGGVSEIAEMLRGSLDQMEGK